MRKKGDGASCLLREVRVQTEVWFGLSRGFEQVDSLQDSGMACSRNVCSILQYSTFLCPHHLQDTVSQSVSQNKPSLNILNKILNTITSGEYRGEF